MAELAAATLDQARAIQRRRKVDEVAMRITLESAERGTVWIARDAAEVIGIAVAHDSEQERYIGDLFVEPSYRGARIGTSLLEQTLDGIDDCARAVLLDVRDATELALALRFGMAPRYSILRFAGAIPGEEELAKMAAGNYRFAVQPIDQTVHGAALNELDRQTRGTARPADHAQFGLAPGGHVFFLSGECVAYAYVWPDGRIGPLACASEAYLVQIFAYALVTLARTYGASWCTALVPGPNRRIARTALRAGLRIVDSFLVAADSAIGDMSTYVACHQLLL